jgi:hypothetical protein
MAFARRIGKGDAMRPLRSLLDPSWIDTSLDSRAVSFENPTGARGAGGQAHRGRKGAPSKLVEAGERVVLADLEGPGTVRHIWLTIPPARPERMRALRLDAYYDGLAEPSISVPVVDFFGCPHGRPVAYDSALVSVHEGRGFNAYVPIPFRRRLRLEFTNESERPTMLYYQLDYTREHELDDGTGYLHVSWRRENPTLQRRDFTIAAGLRGPGRFLGTSFGVRVVDEGQWYGEGEVKVYRDGDTDYPTICGTGLEDYVGSAWGIGRYAAHYAGTPLLVRPPTGGGPNPDFVGFYRWHLPDPIVFERELRVTIQQIGYAAFQESEAARFERYARTNPAAGAGWMRKPRPGVLAHGIAERVDDYCATAYVYCREPQPVPPLDTKQAIADIARREYEQPHGMEIAFG